MPPGLPALRILGAKVMDKLAKAPLLHTIEQRLPDAALGNFCGSMFGKTLDGGAAAQRLRELCVYDPKYAVNMQQALMHLVNPALKQHVDAHGASPSGWNSKALRTAYTSQLPTVDGHAIALVTFEPHPNPKSVVNSPHFMRRLVQSFPGLGAQITRSQYLRLVRGERGIDGTQSPVLMELLPQIAADNAQRVLRGEEPAGPHTLAYNSIVNLRAISRAETAEALFVSGLMETTVWHSQDGIVPWIGMVLSAYPEFIVHISLHFGKNPVAGGDVINSAIVAGLFKQNFRVGTYLAMLEAEMKERFGEQQAAAGLLDPEVRRWFEGQVRKLDWRLSWDRGVLVAMDSALGVVMNHLRLFWGQDTVATVATVDADALADTDDPAAFDRAMEQGVERSAREGYRGTPVLQPSSADGFVIPPAATASGADTVMPGTPQPLIADVTEHADVLSAAARGIGTDLVRKQTAQAISGEVARAIGALADPARTSVKDAAAAVQTPQMREKVHAALESFLLAALAGTAAYAAVSQALGPDDAAELAGLVLIDPLWKRMCDEADGPSYLSLAVEAGVAQHMQVLLTEGGDQLQERAAQEADAADRAGIEQAKAQEALARARAEMQQHPDDPALAQQATDLAAEVSETTQRQQAAVDARAEAERKSAEARTEAARVGTEAQEKAGAELARAERVFGKPEPPKDYYKLLCDAAEDLPLTFIRKQIEQSIAFQAQKRLSDLGDIGTQSLPDLIRQVGTPELRRSVESTLAGLAVAAAANTPEYSTVVAALGESVAADIARSAIADTLWTRMTELGGETSYVDAVLSMAVASERTHWLDENAQRLQQQATQTADAAQSTRDEFSTIRAASERATAALAKDSQNVSLQEEAARLRSEVQAVETRLRDAEQAREDAETADRQNEAALEASRKSEEEAVRQREEQAERVFEKA